METWGHYRTDRVIIMIVKQGNYWVVKSMAGKVLGKHKTKEEALKQLHAVEASKHRR